MEILANGQGPDDLRQDELMVLALTNLSESIQSTDINKALQAILDFAQSLVNADAAQLILRDTSSEALTCVTARDIHANRNHASGYFGEGVVRKAMDSGQTLAIPDLDSEPSDALGSLVTAGFHSAICAPILVGDSAAGALVLCNRIQRQFDLSHMETVAEITRLISDELLKRGGAWFIIKQEPPQITTEADASYRDLEVINRLSNAIISAGSMDELLSTALERCMEAVEANIGSLMLLDNLSQTLKIAVSKGLPDDVVQRWGTRKIGEGLSGWVAQNEKPLLLFDVHSDPRSDPRFRMVADRYDVNSAIVLPLRTRLRLTGVINLARSQDQPQFQPRHAALLETVANQIAVAVERMRMHHEIQRRSLQLTTLMEVGKTITSNLDLGVVTEQVAVQARNLTRAQAALLYYYDPINDRVRFAAQSGCPEDRLREYSELAVVMSLLSARYNRLVFAREIDNDRSRRLRDALDASDWIAIPFRHRGHRIAIGVIAPRPGRTFETDLAELLEQFGSMAAVAIQNARVFHRQHSIARVMQESVITADEVLVDGLEISHRLIPVHEIGGDYYDFITLGDDRVGVVMADVSGSSLKAAAYTTLCKHALRAYAREYRCPAEVLTRLNNLIFEESEAEMFISLFFGIINLRDNTISYAMAGHEPGLLLAAGAIEPQQLLAPGILLGVKKHAQFVAEQQPFAPGDLLTLYTDGFTEVPYKGRKYGIDRLVSCLGRCCTLPVDEMVDHLIADRMHFSDNHNFDDMALISIKRNDHKIAEDVASGI